MNLFRRLSLFFMLASCTLAAHAAGPNITRVRFETTLGSFTVELDADKAPKTVANFLKYVEDKHYDGTIFHRVVRGFVAQGGGFTEDMTQKPVRAPVVSEAKNGLKNVQGSIAMARTSDPDSATSQFYINLTDNDMLDYPSPDGNGYTVFGKVVEGASIFGRMAGLPVKRVGQYENVPASPVIIKSAVIVPLTATQSAPQPQSKK